MARLGVSLKASRPTRIALATYPSPAFKQLHTKNRQKGASIGFAYRAIVGGQRFRSFLNKSATQLKMPRVELHPH